MMRWATTNLALLAISTVLLIGGANAQDVQSLGANPSSDQLIQALTPPAEGATAAGSGALRFRGMQRASSQGATGQAAAVDQRAPAVALDIRFAPNSADLTPESKNAVKTMATAMKSDQLSTYKFRLEGHTDSTGRADLNLALSERRAKAVRDELVNAYGIPAARLQTVGKGQQEPLDPVNPTSAVNRRVQIVNLGP